MAASTRFEDGDFTFRPPARLASLSKFEEIGDVVRLNQTFLERLDDIAHHVVVRFSQVWPIAAHQVDVSAFLQTFALRIGSVK